MSVLPPLPPSNPPPRNIRSATGYTDAAARAYAAGILMSASLGLPPDMCIENGAAALRNFVKVLDEECPQ